MLVKMLRVWNLTKGTGEVIYPWSSNKVSIKIAKAMLKHNNKQKQTKGSKQRCGSSSMNVER